MSFKLHLIIVSFIIVSVWLAWQFMHLMSADVPAATETPSPYSIKVTHASWGTNCRTLVVGDGTVRDAYVEKNSANNKLKNDNVFAAVSLLCNGKMQCDVPIDESVLGADPAPDCNTKMLEIEYRCFSYDRPWLVKASSEGVSLHCEAPPAQKSR